MNLSAALRWFCGFRQAVWLGSRMARKRGFATTSGDKVRYTPIRQVHSYKEKLYSLNSWELFNERTLGDDRSRRISWGLVTCAVFFHRSAEAQVKALCYPPDITDGNKGFLRYIKLLGDDSLTKRRMDGIFYDTYVSRESFHFSDAIYDELFRIFKPDIHTIEQGLPFELSHAQSILAKSMAGARKRIKGVAGSGKSFVLARRAVDAHKRTGGNVLILTYNITLKNYLHDRISEVRENFDWRFFHIENYHQHFNAMLAECSETVFDVAREKWPDEFTDEDTPEGDASHGLLSPEQLEAIYADINVFKGFEEQISRYDVILIDEAQDYREEWVRIIMKYVAAEDAEIVAFADEKQNVYERKLDAGKFPVIPITTGRWDESLNTTYRLNTEIAELSVLFQRHFFSGKYTLDGKIEPTRQLELIFDRVHIEYHLLPVKVTKGIFKALADYIHTLMRVHKLHANDLTVLSSHIDVIRELGEAYSELTTEKVNCMCETCEEYKKIKDNSLKLKNTRKFKKQHFRQNTGCVSFSSIHSFKGLETPAAVLVIGDGEIEESEDPDQPNIKLVRVLQELAYVGITRTRNYLFVINFGDKRYDAFFNLPEVRKLLSPVTVAIAQERDVCLQEDLCL